MLTTGYGTILFHTIGDHGVDYEIQRTAVAEEAFRNHAARAASDIYSLTAVRCEPLTCQPPFVPASRSSLWLRFG
jgi:hypothetical protein